MTHPNREELAEIATELRIAACGLFRLKNERGDYGYFDTLADRIEAAAALRQSPTVEEIKAALEKADDDFGPGLSSWRYRCLAQAIARLYEGRQG